MSRKFQLFVRLALLPALAAPALAATQAVAQEAIMLETLGAVRMLPPDEVRRRDSAEAARQPLIRTARSAGVTVRRAGAAE